MPGLIIIGGPTASGKSALALHLARSLQGVVINADSMQLYRELRILTARPGPAEIAAVPHDLYGILGADEPASVGGWLNLVEAALANAARQGRTAIVVGGTGLYLHALLHGIAPVPEIPAEIRGQARQRMAELGPAVFHAELARLDRKMAERLHPTDRQRLIRAYEVIIGTGRSLVHWQSLPPRRIALPRNCYGFALLPPRQPLYARIERRLDAMLAKGALDELAVLRARGLDPDLPLMKAVAVPELLAHLEGRADLTTAVANAKAATRRYAKRQITWLRHQLPELRPLAEFGEGALRHVDPEALRRCVLTDAALRHSVPNT